MASVSDYVQLMKLRIDSLLLLVAAAGYIATSGVAVDVWRFGLLMLAGLLGAAGASATNHYLDRDLDSVMHRTRTRPLPQHRIEPPAHALEFGVGLLILSLAIAGLGINLLTAVIIGLGYAVYIGVYTVGLKRTPVSNIVIGGFAGSGPALAGSAAAANSISLQAGLLPPPLVPWAPRHLLAPPDPNPEDYRRARPPVLPGRGGGRASAVAVAGPPAVVPPSSLALFFTRA